jgi:hypothetical protein
MSDYLDQYLNLLITQYSDQPKAVEEMTVIIQNSEVVFSFLNAFRLEFDVDTAWGDRLDKLGKVVGISRIVPYGLLKKYFGFDGIGLDTKTFGEARFFRLIRDSGYTDTQLDDHQMQKFIKAKAIVNAVSGFLASDERISLQSAIQILLNGNSFMLDNYNMTSSIFINENIPIDDIILLYAQNLLPKPQGVQLFLIRYYEGNTFGFAGNPNAKTFGQGRFARLITIPAS